MAKHSNSTGAVTTTMIEVNIDNQKIDNDTEAVMKQRIVKPTNEIYERSNTTFILWMFDCHKKYPSLLQHTLYNMMRTNNLEDIYRMTT